MDASPNPAPDSSPTPSAVERAIAFGIDITLLIENLKLTPTERVRRAEEKVKAIFRGELPAEEPWSIEKQIAGLEALLELRKRSSG
jgi:hypothetical protein